MWNETEIREIYENAKKDPSLFSTLDIDHLLSSVENEKNNHLSKKTSATVTKEIYEKLLELPFSNENVEILCNKLLGYRYVDEIHELQKGKVVSWIRIRKSATQEKLEAEKAESTSFALQPKLSGTGIVVNIKFTDTGTNVVISNPPNKRFTQYRFDDCYTFQKMSEEEQLLLMAYEYIER
jgi:hypothetical protein